MHDKNAGLLAFSFCNHCKVADKCCNKIGLRCDLTAPIVTKTEVEQIKNYLKKTIGSPLNNFTGNQDDKTTVIVTNYSGGCIFHENNRCKIYDVRPFDCRIFPLDIFKVGSKFFWVAYETFCEQEIDWSNLLAYGESLLRQYGYDFLRDFVLDISQFPPKAACRRLKEINYSHSSAIETGRGSRIS